MMLDVTGGCLPKNAHGFRTTHTCELCGFEPKTKNKYREKQDHLVMKHFKDKIDKIFPHCRPYACPSSDCAFIGKDKQALLRHYTGKHGILERYLKEALANRGITYSIHPHHPPKRRVASSHADHASAQPPDFSVTDAKRPRPETHHEQPDEVTMMSSGERLSSTYCVSRPGADELRREVEAIMATFQPHAQVTQKLSPKPVVVTLNSAGVQALPTVTTLPALPSAPITFNASIASITSIASLASNGSLSLASSLPLPLEQLLANCTSSSSKSSPSSSVSCSPSPSSDAEPDLSLSCLPDLADLPDLPDQTTQIMWGSGTRVGPSSLVTSLVTSFTTSTTSSSVPQSLPVLVESADSLADVVDHLGSVAYLDTVDSVVDAVDTVDVIDCLDALDYDLLIPGMTSVEAVRERQLDFCML